MLFARLGPYNARGRSAQTLESTGATAPLWRRRVPCHGGRCSSDDALGTLHARTMQRIRSPAAKREAPDYCPRRGARSARRSLPSLDHSTHRRSFCHWQRTSSFPLPPQADTSCDWERTSEWSSGTISLQGRRLSGRRPRSFEARLKVSTLAPLGYADSSVAPLAALALFSVGPHRPSQTRTILRMRRAPSSWRTHHFPHVVHGAPRPNRETAPSLLQKQPFGSREHHRTRVPRLRLVSSS